MITPAIALFEWPLAAPAWWCSAFANTLQLPFPRARVRFLREDFADVLIEGLELREGELMDARLLPGELFGPAKAAR
jgi:hypothetical protein